MKKKIISLVLCLSMLLVIAACGGEKDGEAQEMIADIRFFLHNGGVEAVDLEKGREGWFEFLPASGGGTLRPALAAEGKLLKKGLASA